MVSMRSLSRCSAVFFASKLRTGLSCVAPKRPRTCARLKACHEATGAHVGAVDALVCGYASQQQFDPHAVVARIARHPYIEDNPNNDPQERIFWVG